MIFQRTLRRELSNTAGAVFTALLTITLTIILVRILGQAAGGKVASADVLALLGFTTLNYLPILLVLTLFLSVLLVISRAYRDSEMIVWFASGQSLLRFIDPVLRFALPLVLITGALSFVLSPWATRKSEEFRSRYDQRSDLARVTPGRFQESAKLNRVFFVESVSTPTKAQDKNTNSDTLVKNVFVSHQQNGVEGIVVAKQGVIETLPDGERYLVLQNGKRYELQSGGEEQFRQIEFERYGIRIPTENETTTSAATSRSLPTLDLIRTPDRWNRGELMWRASMPLFALLLALLALPLSFVNPRAGRSANLLLAALIYVIYTNLVSVMQAWVIQEKISLQLGFWPVHILMLILIVLLFVLRIYGRVVRNGLRAQWQSNLSPNLASSEAMPNLHARAENRHQP